MTGYVRAMLDLFVAISLVAAFGQDLYSIAFAKNTGVSAPADISSSNEHQGNSTLEGLPEIKGVVIKVTDGLRKPIQDLLAAEKYNVKI